jgi:drug/metabolite transporter (DMT)-like permease
MKKRDIKTAFFYVVSVFVGVGAIMLLLFQSNHKDFALTKHDLIGIISMLLLIISVILMFYSYTKSKLDNLIDFDDYVKSKKS